jgi:nitroreductase
LPRSVLVGGVRAAIAAPSLHNSQPWRFRIRGSVVEVYADPGRRLRVLDPAGREQLVSVGAAVFNLRLSLRRAGFCTDVAFFPDAEDETFVARVVVTHAAAVTATVEALAAAIVHRHTNRQPFAHTPVPADVLDLLRDAARTEGAVLAMTNSAARDAVLGLARSADRWLRAQPGYRDELARWTGRVHSSDGVPASAAGPWDALETVPIREFADLTAQPRLSEEFEPYPTIMVLATAGDRQLDWVRAGQALQRVLLTATWKDLATTPISQPVEVPAIRRLLIDPVAGLSVQMVLRIGYGRPAGPTPRRPLNDVLLAAERTAGSSRPG